MIKNWICFIGLLLSLLSPLTSFADVTMRVTPNGFGSFLLVGQNVSGMAALDITIDYDTFLLAKPRVMSVRGGDVTGIDAGATGRLSVSISRENPKAAFYLTLNFEVLGNEIGKGINSVTAVGRESVEKTSQTADANITPSYPSSPNSADNEAGKNGSSISSPGGATGIYGGARDYQLPSNSPRKTALNADATTASPWESGKSVLQRFMEFKGLKSLQSFSALFEKGGRGRATQCPSIALSDGRMPVVIKLELQGEAHGSPDIAIWDATLISLLRDGEKNWVVTIIPREGTVEARVIFKIGSEVIDIPLIVSPRVEFTGNVNERNFLAALSDYLSVQDASRGKENILPLSEYIFTANYLADLESSFVKKAP